MSGVATVRRFGTDVSNIPEQTILKTPKSKAPLQSTKKTSKTPKKLEEDNMVATLALEALNLNKDCDDTASVTTPTISLSSPRSMDEFYYERDFLLSLQQLDYCQQAIEGLIAEVLPSFNDNMNSTNPIFTTPTKDSRRNLTIQIPKLSVKKSPLHPSNSDDTQLEEPTSPSSSTVPVSPLGGVVFKPFKSPRGNTANNSFSTPYKSPRSSIVPPVDSNERAVDITSTPNSSLLNGSDSPSSSSTPPPLTLNLEWRVKKVRKQKPREEDPKRLAARQRQIDIGKNTPGFKRFCELVPVDQRTKEHPRVPNIHQVCSKRSWDGQVKKWRRQLHAYDPPEIAGEKKSGDMELDADLLGADDETEDHADSDEEYSSEDEEVELCPTTPTSEVVAH